MAAVPALAVERLRKLEAKLDGWRAQYADLQEGFQHARREAGRLESMLRRDGEGRRLEVDDQGRVFYRDEPGSMTVRRMVGLVSTPDPSDRPREVVRYLGDPIIAGRGRDIARLRREAADLSRRRDELAEKIHPIAALAAASRAEMERRGWHEGEYAAVRQPTVIARTA